MDKEKFNEVLDNVMLACSDQDLLIIIHGTEGEKDISGLMVRANLSNVITLGLLDLAKAQIIMGANAGEMNIVVDPNTG